MKKKILSFIFAICLIITCAFALTACGSENNCSHNFASEWLTNATHHWKQCTSCEEKGMYNEHNYNKEDTAEEYLKTSATTTSRSVYYLSCECGQKGEQTFESGKILGEVKNLAMSSSEIVYGDNYSVNCDDNESVTIEYKYSWDIDESYSTEKPTRAGSYVARVTTSETETHSSVSKTINFEIKPKKLENIHKEIVYNSFEYREVSLDDIESGLFLRILFASKNVGSEMLEVEVRQFVGPNWLEEDVSSNYELVLDGPNACTFELVKKELELSWIEPWRLLFKNDGYGCEPSVQFNNLEVNDWCEGTIQLNSGDNYWYDSTFTYKITGLTGDDAGNYKLPMQNLISPEYTITCDGETELRQKIKLHNLELYEYKNNNQIIKIHVATGGDFKFKYDLSSQGARYDIAVYKKGVTGDGSFVRSFQFVTGVDETDGYSDNFTLASGDYFIEIAKYESATTVGTDTVALYYSYES